MRMLKGAVPRAHLIALSTYHAETYRGYAAKAGASGCLSKSSLNAELKNLIDTLLRASSQGDEKP